MHRYALQLMAATLLLALALHGCARTSVPATAPENRATALEVTEVAVGQGAIATPGAKVTVHYTGWLFDRSAQDRKGRQFDSSRTAGQPFSFMLGAGQVIDGWDQGVAGMRVGGQRRLVIPAALAYGEGGAGGVIPPQATLLFEVELLDVQPGAR